MYVTVSHPNRGTLLFIYKLCPSRTCFFRVASDKFIFVDRRRRDRIDTSRFIARSIDRFRWFQVMYRWGLLLPMNYCMLAKVCLSFKWEYCSGFRFGCDDFSVASWATWPQLKGFLLKVLIQLLYIVEYWNYLQVTKNSNQYYKFFFIWVFFKGCIYYLVKSVYFLNTNHSKHQTTRFWYGNWTRFLIFWSFVTLCVTQ